MTDKEAIKFAECLKNNWTIDFNDMEPFCEYVQQTIKDNKKLKRNYKRVKQQVNIMSAQKDVDVTGDVLEVGKWLCAYYKLREIVKEKL